MDNLSDITAVILAGGMGHRLREAVSDRPKVLADVDGRPFLAYLLDNLADAGVSQIVLCTGYLAEHVRDRFGNCYLGMELVYSREIQSLGTGGAIRLALPLISTNPVLVMNGDSFCNADLGLFFKQHLAAHATASLMLTKVTDTSRYGSVDIDGTGVVTRFVEKGIRPGEGMISAGIYLLTHSVIRAIPETSEVSLEQDVFPKLIKKGLYGFYQSSRFIDIGIPADYKAAAAFFRSSEIVSTGK